MRFPPWASGIEGILTKRCKWGCGLWHGEIVKCQDPPTQATLKIHTNWYIYGALWSQHGPTVTVMKFSLITVLK